MRDYAASGHQVGKREGKGGWIVQNDKKFEIIINIFSFTLQEVSGTFLNTKVISR